MNRENKKRMYDKKYFRTHPCNDSFTCKNCGWPVVSHGAGSDHRNHCPNCLYSVHLDDKPGGQKIGLPRENGAYRRVGAQRRRMGGHS